MTFSECKARSLEYPCVSANLPNGLKLAERGRQEREEAGHRHSPQVGGAAASPMGVRTAAQQASHDSCGSRVKPKRKTKVNIVPGRETTKAQSRVTVTALIAWPTFLAFSKQTWVRTAAAQGLVQLNDRAGWEFFIGVVRQRPFYRDEMVRWLGDVFSVVRDADDAAIITFLESRLATAPTQE